MEEKKIGKEKKKKKERNDIQVKEKGRDSSSIDIDLETTSLPSDVLNECLVGRSLVLLDF